LQKLYDSLDRDLIEARKLQQTLIRDRVRDYGWARVSLILRNSGRVGGDLVGSFRVDDDRVVVYSIDVSGHGVASAMMTARLAGFLTGSSPEQNLAFQDRAEGDQVLLPPDAVAERFNRLMLEEIQAEQYFTMAFASDRPASGGLILCRPATRIPMLIRRRAGANLGTAGLPIGLIPEARASTHRARSAPATGWCLCRTASPNARCPNGRISARTG
jgi:sigma-B regulation protein RsbU (phosphoserine phosphatase)